jgi:FkbM family methyltransferase
MKNIINKIWNSSPKTWFTKLSLTLSYLQFDKVKNGIICKTENQDNELSLLMPFPTPPTYINMLNGSYEDAILKKILKNKIGQELVIWDIGAHMGYQSLMFASIIGPKASVMSFEPNPSNAEWFKTNMALNKKYSTSISLYEKAVSEKVERIDFNVGTRNDATSSGGYMDETTPPLPDSTYKDFKKISIQTTTIDNLISEDNLPIPQIIKIDVEGAELKVIKGGYSTINLHRPELIIEIHNIPMMLYVCDFLRNFSYSIEMMDEENDEIQTRIIYAKYDKNM